MTMVGKKVVSNTHFPNLSIILRTSLNFGRNTPDAVLDAWLSVNDPYRNAGLDTTREQIRRLFAKRRRLFRYHVSPITKTLEVMNGKGAWTDKMAEIKRIDPDFWTHFTGLAGEVIPNMEPKHFHGAPITGQSLREVAEVMITSLNSDSKFDVDTSFGEVFFGKALPEIEDSIRGELEAINFDDPASVKTMPAVSDGVCVRAADNFGEVLGTGQERRLRLMVVKIIADWIIFHASEARAQASAITRLKMAAALAICSLPLPVGPRIMTSLCGMLVAAYCIRKSVRHLVRSSSAQSLMVASFLQFLIRMGFLSPPQRAPTWRQTRSQSGRRHSTEENKAEHV